MKHCCVRKYQLKSIIIKLLSTLLFQMTMLLLVKQKRKQFNVKQIKSVQCMKNRFLTNVIQKTMISIHVYLCFEPALGLLITARAGWFLRLALNVSILFIVHWSKVTSSVNDGTTQYWSGCKVEIIRKKQKVSWVVRILNIATRISLRLPGSWSKISTACVCTESNVVLFIILCLSGSYTCK